MHCDIQNEWFEPTPPLEGDKVEVTDAILASNLQEIEDVQATPEDLNQDEWTNLHPFLISRTSFY